MPVVSKKQGKFMQAVANSPEFANKVGVNQSVGQEFTKEKDMKKVKKMNMGGRAMNDRDGSVAMDPKMQMAMAAQQKRAAMGGMKKGGKVKKNTAKMNNLEELGRVDAEKGYTKKGKKNLKSEKKRLVSQIKKGYKAGGKVTADMEGRAMAAGKLKGSPAKMADARGRAMKTGGMLARTGGSSAKMKAKGKAMKKGGTVKGRGNASKRADGIAQQGHTRGRHV